MGALAVAVFVLDTLTDREIAAAVFYIVIVLLSVRVFRARGVAFVALSCALLTVLSYLLNRSGSHQSGLINGAISLAAITVTAYLALRTTAASARAEEARAQLAHATRVTALGELAASIAHEVNQPLAAIATSGDASLRWLALDVPNVLNATRALQRVVAEAHRASEIIARVRGLAGRGPLEKQPEDPAALIRGVLALTARELRRSDIDLVTTVDDDLPRILVDRVQFQQVMLNLVLNAIDAVNESGNGMRQIHVRADGDRAGVVRIAVQDTGRGFAPEVENRLFDPFFTTKRRGMGMGLAISRSIIEAHGGRLRAERHASRGATFEFTLPAVNEP
jgi:C4-dicarboxylate-specific signal transduction histidine kinase